MAVISIIGTSGVGKSFLIKQLASLECMPALFEGEEGVIPNKIFESVFDNSSPVKRWVWFAERYKKIIERARKISELGLDCYVEEGVITYKAILPYEDKRYHEELEGIIDEVEYLKPDKTVLLTANEGKLIELIKIRGRWSEQNKKALPRALKIQDEFIKLISKEDNSCIIDRSNLDFSKESDLKFILNKIK